MDRYDLVLGGGGVRGAAHVGAVTALADRGMEVHRVAGASAGAMAGALLVAGATPAELRRHLEDVDFRGLAVSDLVARLSGRPLVGRVVERLGHDRTVDPFTWFEGLLEEYGVRTWADLRLDDGVEPHVPSARRYRLVVRCLDVVHRRVVRLPWDYHRYGLDPDEQSVARAVNASMSVPLVFDPVPLGTGERRGLLVDGALGSGFPVGALDRSDGVAPRWPTVAVRLLARPRDEKWPDGDLALARAVIDAMLVAGDAMEPVDEADEQRTVRVDTSAVRSLDVRDQDRVVDELFEAGRASMDAFLDGYDHAAWCRVNRPR